MAVRGEGLAQPHLRPRKSAAAAPRQGEGQIVRQLERQVQTLDHFLLIFGRLGAQAVDLGAEIRELAVVMMSACQVIESGSYGRTA